MSITALTALPLVGDLAKAAGEITKAVAPLVQPFADVAAKTLGDVLKNATAENEKKVEYDCAEKKLTQAITYN
ncbi:MAG: hypothetical protein GAK37_01972 [Pseudomonas sp.]|nr:MAG: hypothetical protein GAK37_01972 [Pseudomonas sp.]